MDSLSAHQSATGIMRDRTRSVASSFKSAFITAGAIIGAVVLLSSELFVLALSSAWAATGLLHTGTVLTVLVYGLAIAGCIYGTVKIVQAAVEAERRPD